MKRAALLSVILSSASAHADEQPGSTWVGAELSVLPRGSFSGEAFNVMLNTDTETAYAVGFFVEDRVTDLVSVGFAPRLIVNEAQSHSDSETGQELDLRLRVAAGHEVLPRLRVFGAVYPGYAVEFPPSNSLISKSHPAGFLIGVGGGLGIALGHRSELTMELGYTWGFENGTQDNVDYTQHYSYFHVAFGIAGTVH